MKKSMLPIILKSPLILLVVLSFIVSVYAALNKLYNISYTTPIIFAVIISLYFLGTFLDKK